MLHQYKLKDLNIVLDPISGSIHLVDDLAYDIIEAYQSQAEAKIISNMQAKYKNISEQEIKDCLADIAELKQNGQLFTEDNYQNLAQNYKNKGKVIKALCLHIAHSCNLNCEYCFAAQGKYHGQEALMSKETAIRAIDFLIENSGSRHNLEVDFFGGEPLLNWQVIVETVNYARQIEKQKNKNFRFTLTTNGMLLNDDIINFANKEMANVVLSLDGRAEIHDKWRVDYNGKGSYQKIVPKFQEFVTKRKHQNYYIRGTFTRENIDFTNDIQHMLDLGFKELSMEPIVCEADNPLGIKEADLPILAEQYNLLAEMMLKEAANGQEFSFYHYMMDFDHGPCVYKCITGCGSGTEYMAVTPQGKLYPCHQFVSDEEYCLGDIWQGITNPSIEQKFKDCTLYSRPDCKDCWAKLYCAGGCAANNYHAGGDILAVYELGCQLFKKRMEAAIYYQIKKEELV